MLFNVMSITFAVEYLTNR